MSTDGKVNYKGIKDDFNYKKYITIISANPPQESWTSDEKLVYWMNAYNAFTVKLIIDNYPLKSIKDIGFAVRCIIF